MFPEKRKKKSRTAKKRTEKIEYKCFFENCVFLRKIRGEGYIYWNEKNIFFVDYIINAEGEHEMTEKW